MKCNFEHEDQYPVFACNGCRDERSVEAADLRVTADGETWCEDCFLEDHTWDEWDALKPFVPRHDREIARLKAELADRDKRIAEIAFNCPSCGRHDFGLLSGPIEENGRLKRELADLREEAGK